MLLVCSSNCCILQLALTATVYLMFGLSTCHTKTCGLQMSGETKNRSVTLRNVDIKLCKVRCMKNSLIFASCHQSTGESKKTETIGGSTNQLSVSSKHCTAKVCNLTRPSLKIGSGRAVRVQATPTASPRLQPADAKLHSACFFGDLSAVRRILSVGQADINCRKNSRTPVMTAAIKGFREVLELLVSNGADVSLVDNKGNNILHMVCLQRDLEAVKYVLSQDMVGINDRGWFERTPVMRAAEKGYKEVVELLVHKGADVTLVDKHGDNILHLACQKNNVEMVKYVLSQDMVGINDRGWYERTPVMRAAEKGYKEVVELLVHKGADVTLVNKHGDNILHLACQKNNVEMVKYVLSQDMVGINDRGCYERTPVMRAARFGYKGVVELLVHKGADVTLVDKHGDNILHLACQKPSVEMVKYVLSQDMVDVDARNNKGQNAVMIVKSLKRLDVLDLLVSRGAHAQ